MSKVTDDLRAMRIGDYREYPVERRSYVKVAASDLGLLLNRRFVTHTSREARTVTVTRIQ